MRNSATLRNLRQGAGADLVLVLHHVNIGAPGQAWVYCGNEDFGRANAFGYVRWNALDPEDLTLAHEIGHLMGGGHDPRNTSLDCRFSDSRGHRFNAKNSRGEQKLYRTIMSYSPGIRTQRLSNPDARFRGVPLGIRGERNNARGILASRRVIANYVIGSDSPTQPGTGPRIEISSPGDNANLPVGEARITTRITDPNGVRSAELYWAKTQNWLSCPGGDDRTWSCTRNGDQFVWTVALRSPGARSFQLRATDNTGAIARTATRTIRVTSEQPQGPLVQFLQPQDGAELPARSEILISSRIADGDGVASAELFWDRTQNYLGCPGNGSNWSCTRSGDQYIWRVKVGAAGRRLYHVRATDQVGEQTVTPVRAVQIK
jgi:hypothetical protein